MWLIYDWNHLIGLAKLNDIGAELKLFSCINHATPLL